MRMFSPGPRFLRPRLSQCPGPALSEADCPTEQEEVLGLGAERSFGFTFEWLIPSFWSCFKRWVWLGEVGLYRQTLFLSGTPRSVVKGRAHMPPTEGAAPATLLSLTGWADVPITFCKANAGLVFCSDWWVKLNHSVAVRYQRWTLSSFSTVPWQHL